MCIDINVIGDGLYYTGDTSTHVRGTHPKVALET